MNIGDRVAIVRKDAGLNQEEFSQRLMVSRSHISNIEKGRKELSASLRKLLCMEFFVNEDWLLTGEGERYNQAAKDVLDLEDAGRGQKDRFGREKAVALQSAAWLYSIYPNVAASCSSVEQLLMLFGDAEFCELFNMIAVMYILKVAGRGEMYDAIKLLASQVSNLGNLDELLNRADTNIKMHNEQNVTKYLRQIVSDQKIEDKLCNMIGCQKSLRFSGWKEFFEQSHTE